MMIKTPVRCDDCGDRDRDNMYRLDDADPRMFCGNCARLRVLAKVDEMFPAPRPARPEPTDDDVLEAIRTLRTLRDVQRKVGRSTAWLQQAIARLKAAGRVTRDARTMLWIPTDPTWRRTARPSYNASAAVYAE
jgi:hypothetical protein